MIKETERLILRPWREEDAETILTLEQGAKLNELVKTIHCCKLYHRYS